MTEPVDLRSDTLTKPTAGMREAMARAEVGDDVYGEDPTVRVLEERVAALFGHEAALFTPTGSMANVLSVRSIVGPGQEVLCSESAHIARAELGAHAAYTGITMRTWSGVLDLDAIARMFAPDMGPFFVRTKALSVENTHNFAGGSIVSATSLNALRELADGWDISIHLDGARIWNAHIASGTPLAAYGAIADTMAVCLSKGLGAPVGSLVLGSSAMIADARIWRKRMGGGMRQTGILAAAGLYALDNNVDRLADDHANAKVLAYACGIDPNLVDTNIVVFDHLDAATLVRQARDAGVLISAVGPSTIRLVTHLGVSNQAATEAASVLASLI